MQDPRAFRNPTVRHLAWMSRAPQLITGEDCFQPRHEMAAPAWEKLIVWDSDPASGPPLLQEAAQRRLGIHFENLYACLMSELLGWEVLARNLPVHDRAGRTLGELDIVLRHPVTGLVEHHEIAVKFYLGFRSAGGRAYWYGPNNRDRLDIKTRRLREHQIPLSHSEAARAALAARQIPTPGHTRVFMPGYLFYPAAETLSAPAQVAADHERGRWLRLSAAQECDHSHWQPLHKPDWLGPQTQSTAADARRSEQVLEQIASQNRPRLFAKLSPADDGYWRETERFFVVPQDWPGSEL